MKLKDPRDTLAAMTARSLPCESFLASWDQPAWLHKATQTFEIGVAMAGRAFNDPEWKETRAVLQEICDKATEARRGK